MGPQDLVHVVTLHKISCILGLKDNSVCSYCDFNASQTLFSKSASYLRHSFWHTAYLWHTHVEQRGAQFKNKNYCEDTVRITTRTAFWHLALISAYFQIDFSFPCICLCICAMSSAKTFRHVINRTCKWNFWLHVFPT